MGRSTPLKEEHCKKQICASGSMKSTPLKEEHCKIRASGSKRSTPPKEVHCKKINLCLKVTEIDLINESTHQKREPKSCLEVNEIDFTKKKNTVKNKYASRSPKSTSTQRAPIRR